MKRFFEVRFMWFQAEGNMTVLKVFATGATQKEALAFACTEADRIGCIRADQIRVEERMDGGSGPDPRDFTPTTEPEPEPALN